MKKIINAIIGITISVVFIYFLTKKIDFKEVINNIKHLQIEYISYFIIVSIINISIKGYRWFILTFDKNKNKKTIYNFIKIIVIGANFNNILPLRMGDIIRGYLVSKKYHIKKSYIFGTIIIERIFDLLSLFMLLSLFTIIISNTTIHIPQYIKHISKIGLLLSLGFTIILIYFHRYKIFFIEKLNKLHNIKILTKFTKTIDSLMDGFMVLNKNHHILKALFISITIWMIEAFSFFLIGLAFNINIGFTPFILVMVSVCLGTLIPSGPGYIGVFEGAASTGLIIFGISKEIAIAYAIIIHCIQIIIAGIIGGIFSINEGIKISEIIKKSKTIPSQPSHK